MTAQTYNGWANWETWNAALWIQNDEFLYNTAKAIVEFAEPDCTPMGNWRRFIRCMMEGQVGRYLGATGDGVRWDDPAINSCEMGALFEEIEEELS
jgi:hypothetical protein